jgi:hypothetical protein
MAGRPTSPAKNIEGDFDQFKDFMRKLVAVPHSKIRARLEEEKREKRTPKPSVSRAPNAS